mmetsp:Transcript_23512/g.50311  ORF Transcript_23512/g.50311 Transcript_23512/m.50311 type:complete len:277 (-) Transcript_23512:89-919(-)
MCSNNYYLLQKSKNHEEILFTPHHCVGSMAFECKSQWRPWAAIAAIVWTCASIAMRQLQFDRGNLQHQRRHRHLRSLQLTEYIANPMNASPRFARDDDGSDDGGGEDNMDTINIHFYVKTTDEVRADDGEATEARGSIRFQFDNDHRDDAEEPPSASLRHVERTDDPEGVGREGGEGSRSSGSRARADESLRLVAYKAQRLETKTPIDWACYLDSAVVVNADDLKTDSNSDENEKRGGGIQYMGGGWYIDYTLAQHVGELLGKRTDEDLHWDCWEA